MGLLLLNWDMDTLIHLPYINMREAPTEKSKVASQALFGEKVKLLKTSGQWAHIETPDGYTGWIEEGSFVQREAPYSPDLQITRLKAHLYGEKDTEFGPLISLPYGAKLELLDPSDPRWVKVLLPDGGEAFVQKGDLEPEPFELVSFSKKFLGIPYTWGGRSSFGYDCSGYVQMLYNQLGILLPRDARLQIADRRGKAVVLNQLVLGDLIFWGKSEGDIRHVGMFLGAGEFIHTSTRENRPYVRISQLTDFEWSGDQNAHYPFRAARRFFEWK